MVELWTKSAAILRARTNSRAVLESKPRVELQKSSLTCPTELWRLLALLIPRSDQTSRSQSFTNSLNEKLGRRVTKWKRIVHTNFSPTHSSYSSISNRCILEVVKTKNNISRWPLYVIAVLVLSLQTWPRSAFSEITCSDLFFRQLFTQRTG